MVKDLVSIIVPVYNVEPYLNDCLNSIANQIYNNLEIIVINDGSTDNSGKLLNEFSHNDNRFKIIHKENAGTCAARNLGLDTCTGNYIAFIDSDDYVENYFISSMYDAIILTHSDIVVCGFFSGDRLIPNPGPCILIGDDILSAHISTNPEKRLYHHIFNKLYTRSIIDQIRFPIVRQESKIKRDYLEDGVFNSKVLPRAKKVCRVSVNPYHYRVREDSMLHRERTIWEILGNTINVYEIHANLIENVDRKSDLRAAVHDFLDCVYRDIMSPLMEIDNIFALIKNIAVRNDLKISTVVQNDPVERTIFQLLLSETNYQSMREKLQKNLS